MPRSLRILSATNTSPNNKTDVAEPPETVNVESDLVVILAALLCALICVVGLVAVARCAWLRRSASGGSARSPPQANKGIKKKKLESLPKFTYSTTRETDFKKFNSTECAICLAEFVEGDELRVLPQCGHGFHVGCIDMWLGSHSSCPSCRQILVVARCQKCGQFPAIPSPSSSTSCGGAASPDVELKSREGSSGSISVHTTQAQNASYLP